jgi:type VI secretion system protein VasD
MNLNTWQRRPTVLLGYLGLAAWLSLTLGACKSAPPPPPPPPPPKPITAVITVVAASDINLNHSGRPSPVLLRLFQLKDGAKFLSASFDDVTARSDQVLAAALVGSDARMVQPGTTVSVSLEVPPETRLLGVVAEYSDLANSQWRAASPAPEGGLLTLFKDHTLLVTVDRQAVAVGIAPPKGK